jgi:hypothetical protein
MRPTLALILLAPALQAGPIDLNPDLWTLSSETGDRGRLSADHGALVLEFDATVTREYQFGHVRLRQAAYSLNLVQPVPLSTEQTRVFFTAQGLLQPYSRSEDSFVLYPVIRDESGEEFVYTPYPETFLGQGTDWNIPPDRWQRWRSSYFYANEAGGAATDIFQAEGGDRNNWPDGSSSPRSCWAARSCRNTPLIFLRATR